MPPASSWANAGEDAGSCLPRVNVSNPASRSSDMKASLRVYRGLGSSVESNAKPVAGSSATALPVSVA